MRERHVWNGLYRRAMIGAPRSAAERESVPVPTTWGDLPPQERTANAFLEQKLETSRRWLDLGCGTGSILAAFLTRYPHASAMGIDASDVAVSYGRSQLIQRGPLLARRMELVRGDLKDVAAGAGRFDLILALFCLQFLRLSEFYALLAQLRDRVLTTRGALAGTVRSNARSVPASYVPDADEANTYRSFEPHEWGMTYHHYAGGEIHAAAEILRGRVTHIQEVFNDRAYDDAPHRAWWNFVIEVS